MNDDFNMQGNSPLSVFFLLSKLTLSDAPIDDVQKDCSLDSRH